MFDPFLAGPLPTTVSDLLAACGALRQRMGERSESLEERDRALQDGPAIVARLWEAMRAIGGIVPPEPVIESVGLADHWRADPDGKLREYRAAVDTAIAWCEARQGSKPMSPARLREVRPDLLTRATGAAKADPAADKLRLVAFAGLNLARQIREWFPVAGKPWHSDNLTPHVGDHVVNAALLMEQALTDLPHSACSDGRRLYKLPGLWRAILDALESLEICFDRLLSHYRLADRVRGRASKPSPWEWPDVPPIAPALLDDLGNAAERLDRFLADGLPAQSASDTPAEPPGGWSEPKPPSAWKRIFGVHRSTIMRWFKSGKIRCKKITSKSYHVANADLPTAQKPPTK